MPVVHACAHHRADACARGQWLEACGCAALGPSLREEGVAGLADFRELTSDDIKELVTRAL